MPDRSKAYKAWVQAIERMRTTLTANPLVADPLKASAQVFEDIGRMMFGGNDAPKNPKRKRAKSKRAPAKKMRPARKKPAARRRTRKG